MGVGQERAKQFDDAQEQRKEDIQIAQDMKRAGLSNAAIASQLGKTESSVRHLLKP